MARAPKSLFLLCLLTGGGMVLLSKMSSAVHGTQTQSPLLLRARHAMDRLDTMIGRAVSTDAGFGLFNASAQGSPGFRAMTFREVDSISAGAVQYHDQLPVYVLSPGKYDQGESCQGLVIGRGPDITTIGGLGAGSDHVLGTTDDDVRASVDGSTLAVELLLAPDASPAAGRMLAIVQSATGLRLTVTLRLNARDRHGELLFEDDLVLTQEISLRQ